ncbi:bifunctional UDP-N-acetylglucosamine diphosphorylase/glucosamine-1-phosphate N-acetyltransferase GlmU [Solirubrobacter phytolaccae]|uniref:Bifunctional protein GlmU n=1 Tax=Solirubrobacter phytolaccae TaxID=1404360 RepID=A0A9X3NI39_9ACTN|nr:bifunctional UDP-N-acetylglucosamine diphosphorylase/glucosamine-1-phosphate N-acetyltransferase GlmU [Solirubrobacter phytolaccae]MDA0185694.1 bifunctional UDP-N-acetylglucosamine diphosphorylase/glucosamine-1-phosphate N-acetyltransferase GlmU [Solirubrobacter phytolaccae]
MSAPTVVIIAAGEGTRMRSKLPKVLHPLCGRPLILWPVTAAQEAGAGKVVVVDNPKRRLEDRLPDGVEIAVQPEPNGTGGAVQAATEHIDPDTTVVILAGDVPLITAAAIDALVKAHEDSEAAGTMATMELDDPGQYGRVVRDKTGNVEKVVEAKSGEGDATPEQLEIREVNTGIYAFQGAALLDALDRLEPDNAQGELYLPDVLPQLKAAGKTIAAHLITDHTLTLGVNDRVQLAEVRQIAQQRIHDELQRAGVAILDPKSTHIDADVTIGQDTVVEPGTSLKGNTSIGADCAIGPHTTIIDSQLGDGVSVPHSYLVSARVDDFGTIGPFAYLRPDAHLHQNAKAGAFVEIKNSNIGRGSKVPHLSYIGDADIGENTNIGASNITANYDGRKKHRTRIGSNVRTSVDTAFVAPVEVGDGAFTAAGSVITEDVPANALGVARARQTNIADYADRRKP